MHILFVLQTAFSLYMVYDAFRREAPLWWIVIVLVPFGEWIYFFVVFLPNQQYGEVLRRTLFKQKPVPLDVLRRERRQTPSHRNLVRLAQGLHDHGEYREAAELFAEVLQANETDKDALYGYARCAFEEGERAAEIEALERLTELDIAFDDYNACSDLARAYWDTDRRDDAIRVLERLCKSSQRLGPRVVLARYLIDMDRADDARRWLADGLDAYTGSPRYVRRRDRRHAKDARSMLGKLR